MEFEQILKILSLISSFGLIFFSWQKFTSRFEKYSYSISQLLFLLPMVLNFDESLADTWARHLIFYTAQITLFFFLNSFINFNENKQNFTSKNLTAFTVVPLAASNDSNIFRWFRYITVQGIEHFLALPLLFLTVTMVRLKIINIAQSAKRNFINWTVIGVSTLTMIHVAEFLIESQKLVHVEESTFELLEHGLFLVGIGCFFIAVLKLSDKSKINNENQI